MGRRLRTRLDQLHPDSARRMKQKQSIPGKKVKSFIVGDKVFARAYSGQDKRIPATVSEVTGPVSYIVSLADDSKIRRHIDQLRPRSSKDDDTSTDIIEDNDIDDQGPYFTHSPVIEPSRTTAPSSRNCRPVDRYAPVMST